MKIHVWMPYTVEFYQNIAFHFVCLLWQTILLSVDTYRTHCSNNTLSPPSPSCIHSCRKHHAWSRTLKRRRQEGEGGHEKKRKCLSHPTRSQAPIPASLGKKKVVVTKPTRYIFLFSWQNEVGVCDELTSVLQFPSHLLYISFITMRLRTKGDADS